jgi:hypothetical protein
MFKAQIEPKLMSNYAHDLLDPNATTIGPGGPSASHTIGTHGKTSRPLRENLQFGAVTLPDSDDDLFWSRVGLYPAQSKTVQISTQPPTERDDIQAETKPFMLVVCSKFLRERSFNNHTPAM